MVCCWGAEGRTPARWAFVGIGDWCFVVAVVIRGRGFRDVVRSAVYRCRCVLYYCISGDWGGPRTAKLSPQHRAYMC